MKAKFVAAVRKIECGVDEIKTYRFVIIFQVNNLDRSFNNTHSFYFRYFCVALVLDKVERAQCNAVAGISQEDLCHLNGILKSLKQMTVWKGVINNNLLPPSRSQPL